MLKNRQVSHWGSHRLAINQSPMSFHLLQIALFVWVFFCYWHLSLCLLWDPLVISSSWIQLCVQVMLLWDESSVLPIFPGMLGKASKVYGPEESCSILPFMACTVEQSCHDHEVFVTKMNSSNHFWCLLSYPSGFCWNINWPSEKQVLLISKYWFCKVCYLLEQVFHHELYWKESHINIQWCIIFSVIPI